MAVSTKTRGNPILKTENAAKKMTPEIYFARKLASNEKKIRDRSLKKLRRWIAARSAVPDAFTDDELMKLWKGLFYCMWMSDKPLIQEDLAETISELVHSIIDRMTGLKFITAALKTMARDWSGIDTWRMDKFLMFVRRIVRHSLEYLAQRNWNEEEVDAYSKMLSDVIINANESTAVLNVPIGLQLHITNLFPEELAKAGGEELSSSTISKMFEPFAKCLATSNDYRLKKDVHQNVFTYLIKQSDEALEYEDLDLEKQAVISMSDAKANRKKAKKSKKNRVAVEEESNEEKEEETNPPAETDDEDEEEDAEEAVGEDDMEMEESNFDWGAKDPRAGGVDSIIPQIKPDYNQIADLLFQMASDKSVRAKNRKSIYDIVKKFRDLASGIYPLAVDFPVVGPGLTPRYMKSAAKQFIKDELSMTEQRNADRIEMRKSSKAYRKLQGVETDISDELLEDVFEGEGDGAAIDEEGSDADVLDSDDEENGEEEGDDDEEENDDEEDEEDEDADEELDSSDEENLSGEDEEISDDEEEEEKLPVAPKKLAKEAAKPKRPQTTFEVENSWGEETVIPPASIQQLKQKLKAEKRQKNSGWTESPSKGEIEIVIPNKKFKGSAKLHSVQSLATPENYTNSSKNSGNRRVNFVLNKNTAQEPKDYQESLRKSPGVPHDPDRQPSGGGVLKRNDTKATKLASSPVTRKPQRTGRLSSRF